MSDAYSATPLAKKLNLRDGQRVWFHAMPEHVEDEIGDYALALVPVSGPEESPDAAHLFVTDRADLVRHLVSLRDTMARDGHVWVSWPKKGSLVPTDITEDVIRELGLPMGYVDTKVCAIDDIWSGLKLVIRKELR